VLDRLQQSQQLADLEMQAQAGNGAAFDQMVMLATNPATTKDLRESMLSGARDILGKHNGLHSTRHFLQPMTDEQFIQALTDADSFSRQAALDMIPLEVLRKHLDELFKIMTTDPNLSVREAGFVRFNELIVAGTKIDHVENLDNYNANLYFVAHRQEMIDGKKSDTKTPPSSNPK
jgi:hypothetical protein